MKLQEKEISVYETEYQSATERLMREMPPFKEAEQLLEVVRSHFSLVEYRTRNPKVMILGSGFPEELVHAFGVTPYWVLGGSLQAGTWAGELAPRDADPVSRSILGFLLGMEETARDALILLPIVSDSTRKLAYLLRREGLNIHTLDIPPVKNESAPLKYERQLELCVTVQKDAPCGGGRDAPADSKHPKSEQPKKKGRDSFRFEDAGKTAQSSKLRHEVENAKADHAAKTGKPGKTVERPSSVKPHSQTAGVIVAAPIKAAVRGVHREIAKYEDDNVGIKGVHSLEQSAELCGRAMTHSARSRKLKLHRRAEKAEKRLEKANVNLLFQKSLRDDPHPSGNPLSRLRRKRRIKKQYAAALRKQQSAGGTVSAVRHGIKQAASGTGKTVGFIVRHKKGVVLIGLAFFALVFLLNLLSSCSTLLEGGLSVLGGSTYPSADVDVLGAEAAYAGMETDLEKYLNDYEDTHNYDEYIYELDPIGHDPYALAALLSALHPGGWILEEVKDTLETLFTLQYVLSETVTEETRYDEDDAPYTYSICTVRLETTDMSHLPVYLLDDAGMSLYATYMATGGNRPDLFPSSEYPNAVQRGDYLDYDVPPEALEDETFAAMLSEAEKYLGWPYVWGGASPATSFDCSGFVSWVINHSGWNYGRLTAQGLFNVSTPVTAANARPGDLVFFKGTYNTTEVSHVGIYVGNHRMIHAGDPISYANLDENYWQQHLFCYGRIS